MVIFAHSLVNTVGANMGYHSWQKQERFKGAVNISLSGNASDDFDLNSFRGGIRPVLNGPSRIRYGFMNVLGFSLTRRTVKFWYGVTKSPDDPNLEGFGW